MSISAHKHPQHIENEVKREEHERNPKNKGTDFIELPIYVKRDSQQQQHSKNPRSPHLKKGQIFDWRQPKEHGRQRTQLSKIDESWKSLVGLGNVSVNVSWVGMIRRKGGVKSVGGRE